jgi:branched-chain amino acid transport system permease protein
MTRSVLFLTGIAACMALTIPLFGSQYLTTHATRILIYAIFAMSLDLLVGYCGLVSLGHAAFFGVAAYTTALLSAKLGISNILISLPLSILATALVALAIGLLTLRTGGIYFIMATLAFAQMLFFLVNDNAFFGGSDGILLLTRFSLGTPSLNVSDPVVRYYFAVAAAFLTFVFLYFLVRSPFGRILQGIKSNERRMRALGYSIARYKLACFVIGGVLAGLAGHLYVLLTSLADPSILDWVHSAQVLMMVILGGMGTLVGPVIGAILLIELIDQAAEFTEHWKLIVGVVVVAVTLFGKGGLAGMWSTAAARLGGARSRP